MIDTNGSGHGALAGMLSALNIDVLICGGIGEAAGTSTTTVFSDTSLIA